MADKLESFITQQMISSYLFLAGYILFLSHRGTLTYTERGGNQALTLMPHFLIGISLCQLQNPRQHESSYKGSEKAVIFFKLLNEFYYRVVQRLSQPNFLALPSQNSRLSPTSNLSPFKIVSFSKSVGQCLFCKEVPFVFFLDSTCMRA